MRSVIIAGAGPSGLTTGYLLAKRGCSVTIVEKGDTIGGLLRTSQIDGVEIENVYHHILFNDSHLVRFLQELGLDDRLNWYRSRVGIYTNGRFFDITTPLNYLSLRFLDFSERIKLIYNLTFPGKGADNLARKFGENIYRSLIREMLINKFGIYADKISPDWFINKIRKRGRSRYILYERLGYLEGSFRCFIEAIREYLQMGGHRIFTNASIESIGKINDKFRVSIDNKSEDYDCVVFTISPYDIADLVDGIEPDFSNSLRSLDFMSNITILLYTRKNLTDYYWINIADSNIGLTGIISQSNLIRYEGLRGYFTYVSLYLPKDDERLDLDSENILSYVISELKKMGIVLSKGEVIQYVVSKTHYAQPLYRDERDLFLNRLTTPIKNLYVLNSHSILPEDRGLDNIVRKAESLTRLIVDNR